MLTVFGRVALALRHQDWMTVAVEFIVVVLGIFVGLQVNNWNESRHDAVRTHDYLERIRGDLGTDLETFDNRLHLWNNIRRYGDTALDFAEGNTLSTKPWQALLAFFQASQQADFVISRATFDEMTSAGAIGLIPDVGLRGRLAGYYGSSSNTSWPITNAYSVQIRGAIPLNIQKYIWDSCYVYADDKEQLLECDSPISESDAIEIVESIVADKELVADLQYWMSILQVSSIIARDRQKAVAKLRHDVESMLGPVSLQNLAPDESS